MELPVPEKLDGGRAIVIEDLPSDTGIGDLIGAFSPFGPIRFASVGPPAVVGFENEASAAHAHALLVASMKSVSLLGAFSEKKLQVPAPAQPAATSGNHPSPSSALVPPPGASPETEISSNEASPAEAAAPQTEMSPAAKAALMAEILDTLLIFMGQLKDSMRQLDSGLRGLGRVEEGGHDQIQNGSNPVAAVSRSS